MRKGVILNFLLKFMWNSVKLRFMEIYRFIMTTTVPISVVPFVFQFFRKASNILMVVQRRMMREIMCKES